MANLPANARADDRIPHISSMWYLRKELERVRYLERSLRDLSNYVEHFEAALRLFDLCEENYNLVRRKVDPRDPTIRRAYLWKTICARDGAICVFHFGKTMQIIKAALKVLPSLRGKVYRPHLRKAAQLFSGWFPRYESVRTSIAHSWEFYQGAQTFKRNALRGSMVRNHLRGRVFSNTFDGKLFSYEISQLSLDRLNDVKREFYKAFVLKGLED